MSLTPTQLSKRQLEADGWLVAVVEKWNPHARIRQDLFGIVDLLAIREGETLGVQTTSYANASARIKKIAESEHIAVIRAAGWAVHVHGWRKVDGRWTCRVVDVS